MRAPVAAMVLALALTACASSRLDLPYKPEVQPSGATLSAAYTIVADRLRVEIATDGRRLERAQIVRPDGGLLEAQTIEYSPPVGGGGSPVGIGFGIGSFGSMGGGVSTGVGVSTGTTVGGGSSVLRGGPVHIASFPLAHAGPSPWRVRVKLQGIDPADILVGEPTGEPRAALSLAPRRLSGGAGPAAATRAALGGLGVTGVAAAPPSPRACAASPPQQARQRAVGEHPCRRSGSARSSWSRCPRGRCAAPARRTPGRAGRTGRAPPCRAGTR